MDGRRRTLDELTRRWRSRRDLRRKAGGGERPPAEPEREARARAAFPYGTMTALEYAERHADDMIGFTFDEYTYADAELDAWLRELGALLRRRRRGADG